MKNNIYLTLSILLFLFSSCVTNSYFTSPTNGNSVPYHTIPLKADSTKGATYASGLFTAGGANSGWRDGLYSFQGRIYRGENFGSFQAYYGANISIGNYHVSNYTLYEHPYDTGRFQIPTSNQYYGTYGFNGGINTVIPFPKGRGEWRAIGIETSVIKEFGNYYNFRKALVDSSADVIFRNNITGTLGISTDIIGRSRGGTEFGYKAAVGFMLNPISDYTHVYNPGDVNPILYASHTLHLTKQNVTGFLQFNISTYHAGSIQFGFSYKL
jgi:hypothetical protein